MVNLMVMMVMMVVGVGAVVIGYALLFRANLVGGFRFNCTVIYSVFPKFLPHRLFDKCRVALRHNMKGCNVIETVKGGNVQMVNILHSLDFPYMLFEFIYVYAVGGFFKEYITDFLKISQSLNKQEQGNSYGHCRVDIGNVREFH